MMKQMGSEPDPLSFGWFLFRMSEFNKAERYVKYVLAQLPTNDKAIGNAYNLLGLIYKDTHKLDQSVEYYEKALKIYSQLNYQDSPQVIATHCNLGLAFLALEDPRSAEEQQRQAEEKLLNSSHSKNSLVLTSLESLKAKIQVEYGNNAIALKDFEMVLKTRQQQLPATHFSIASTWNAIGIVQEKLHNDVEALKSFQQALDIGQKSLPPEDMDLAEYHTNVARIYGNQKKFQFALKHFELALKIMENYREEEYDKIIKLNKHIADTKEKLCQS
ncbi:unnamed protein product [Rotaria sp. Silwood1]|nr:unnamed protein product [Rotaria sp. Silwood1]CAF4591987.1 unnamed protein product [Rotaria sp. Silwood1]